MQIYLLHQYADIEFLDSLISTQPARSSEWHWNKEKIENLFMNVTANIRPYYIKEMQCYVNNDEYTKTQELAEESRRRHEAS